MNGVKFDKKLNGSAICLILLGWLVYTISYLGKVNYSANITQIIDYYGVTKAQAGTAPTFFFFAYGIGQVFNGFFCKKYNIKLMVFASLLSSGVINLIIATSESFSFIKWLWLINGFALSILWPSLIRLLSENLPAKALGKSSVIMGTTVASGTLIIYALSSVFAAVATFKLAFFTAAFSMIAVSFVWLLFYRRFVGYAICEREAEEVSPASEKENNKKVTGDIAIYNNKRIFIATIVILCFYAVGVNLIKDGLTTWVPSILKEEFSFSDSLSILLTLFLPILAVFGNAFALTVHKRIPDYVNHCASAFLICAVLICVIIGSLSSGNAIFMLLGLVSVNFLASSLNSVLTSIFPMFMRERLNSGMFAGILNGFCYVGSTLSSYGLGAVADGWGWTAVFYTLLAFCAVVIFVWCLYGLFKKKA